ncbi:UDP-N-acetylmuramate dehydrogenase [Helicobacter sp. 23-1044]
MTEKIIDFCKYSAIKIGPKIPVKIAQNIDEILALQDSHTIIGGANNMLLSPQNHALFMLGSEFDYISDLGECIEVGAGCNARKAFLYFRAQDLGGLEFLGTIPGKMGGIVKMNAGMKSFEVANAIHSVCENGVWRENVAFSYRKSAISGAISAVRFKKISGFDEKVESQCKIMRSNQPKGASAGSFFRNPREVPRGFEVPKSAGELLEMAGFKGQKIGGVKFSEIHANFLINCGGGSFADAINLTNLAKDAVTDKFSVELKSEVVIL